MALDKTVLGALITSKVNALSNADKGVQAKVLEAIADAVVTHITTLGVVTVPIGVAVQVTPATGTGATIAPGVGTIS